jgi:heme exporter protein C
VLGYAIEDEERKARISSVYALLSFVTVPFLVFIIPRINTTLHPDIITNAANTDSQSGMGANIIIVLVLAIIGVTALYAWLLRVFAVRQRRRLREQYKEIEQIGEE